LCLLIQCAVCACKTEHFMTDT